MILIDMDMPKNCNECQLRDFGDGHQDVWCSYKREPIDEKETGEKRPEWCPLKDTSGIFNMLKEQGRRIEELEIDRDILVQDINFHNCNTCKRQCEIRPEPGEVVRVNCYLWSEKEHT